MTTFEKLTDQQLKIASYITMAIISLPAFAVAGAYVLNAVIVATTPEGWAGSLQQANT